MDSPALTLLHVAISLAGVASGLVAAWGMLTARRLPAWTALFLLATLATSVTGFVFFHRATILPSHITGILSLALLAVAIPALYVFRLRGGWRVAYVVTALASLYLNVFVLVIQSFQKIAPLHALAPTQSTEPAFVVTQAIVLLSFVAAGATAVRRFRFSIFV